MFYHVLPNMSTYRLEFWYALKTVETNQGLKHYETTRAFFHHTNQKDLLGIPQFLPLFRLGWGVESYEPA